MNNNHPFGSPNPKTYKSTIRQAPKQSTRSLVQKIVKNILEYKFNEALHICTTYDFKELQKITKLCNEFSLLKYSLNNEIEKVKQESLLTSKFLSKQFKYVLTIAIKYKQSWINHKKYCQEINNYLRKLLIQQNIDNKQINGADEYFQKIKESLITVTVFISNLKEQVSKSKQSISKLQQQKNEFNKSIKILNLAIDKKNKQFEANKNINLVQVRQKEKLMKQIQALKSQTAEFERNLEQKLKVSNQLVSTIEVQKNQLKQGFKELLKQNKRLQYQFALQKQKTQNSIQRIKEYEQSKKEWFLEKKKYKDELRQKNDTINSLISNIQYGNEIVSDLQAQQKANKQKIQELIAKVHQMESQYQLLKNQVQQNFVNHQTQTSNFSQQMADLHIQNQQLASQLTNQYQYKNILLSKIQEVQMQLQQNKRQKRSLQVQIKQLDQENDKLIKQVNHLTQELQKLNQDFLYAETKIHEMKLIKTKNSLEVKDQGINTLLSLDDLNQIQNKIEEDQQMIKYFEQKIKALNHSLLEMQQLKNQESRKLLQLESSYRKILRDVDLSTIQRKDLFFVGKILGQQSEGRQYLQSVIQKAQRRTIRKTVLLYQLDTLNKTNIHKYVDNVPNIVLLIKTVASWVVAGFSQGPFYSKMISDKNGLIISVSGRDYFGLKVPNKRAIAYDDYFIIFGNSQIRIKSQEFKLFSNFAINSSYYNSRQHRVEMITGEKGSREVLILHVQAFQVEFY